jgi:hypothetical protein
LAVITVSGFGGEPFPRHTCIRGGRRTNVLPTIYGVARRITKIPSFLERRWSNSLFTFRHRLRQRFANEFPRGINRRAKSLRERGNCQDFCGRTPFADDLCHGFVVVNITRCHYDSSKLIDECSAVLRWKKLKPGERLSERIRQNGRTVRSEVANGPCERTKRLGAIFISIGSTQHQIWLVASLEPDVTRINVSSNVLRVPKKI